MDSTHHSYWRPFGLAFRNCQGVLPFLGKVLGGRAFDLVQRGCPDLHFGPLAFFFSNPLDSHKC